MSSGSCPKKDLITCIFTVKARHIPQSHVSHSYILLMIFRRVLVTVLFCSLAIEHNQMELVQFLAGQEVMLLRTHFSAHRLGRTPICNSKNYYISENPNSFRRFYNCVTQYLLYFLIWLWCLVSLTIFVKGQWTTFL